MANATIKGRVKVFGMFIAAFAVYAGLLWLPELAGFELSGPAAIIYSIITVLPILGIFAIYIKIFLKADEFFQRRFLFITSFAFLLAAFYGILSITFRHFAINLFMGQSIWMVLAACWLISYFAFLLRSK